jgi:hypothetical protein
MQQLQQQHAENMQTLQREHESARSILQQKVLELQVWDVSEVYTR